MDTIKPLSLNVTAQCSGVQVSYNCIAAQENIADVVFNSMYLEQNREEILQQFLALALYDCSVIIMNDIKRRLHDGNTATPN